MDIWGQIPVIDRKFFQMWDVNLESWLDTMSLGRPCRHHISWAKIHARSSVFFVSCSRGMKWAICKNQLITTHNPVQLFDWGRLVMKSMAIVCHGASGSSRGERSTYLLWCRDMFLWQSGHTSMYFSMSETIPGLQIFRHTSSIVLSCPKYPATLLSCSDSSVVVIIAFDMYTRPR